LGAADWQEAENDHGDYGKAFQEAHGISLA
jgi:hypothetical protein